MNRRSLQHALLVALVLVGCALLGPLLDLPGRGGFFLLNRQNHFLFTDVCINIVLAVSLNLILGITGQFSLGHAGFLAAGAYTCAVVTGTPEFMLPQLQLWIGLLHLPGSLAFVMIFFAGVLAAMLVTGALGWIVGMPALRLRGDYLAIATLGFGEIVANIIVTIAYVGAATGFLVWGARNTWVGQALPSPYTQAIKDSVEAPYLISASWTLASVVLTILIVRNIKYSTTGRALLAIREDVIASEAVGVPTTRYKVTAFVLGAVLAGLAGAILSQYKPLNPNEFRFMRSVELVLMVILGGQGSITGSILAATVLTLLPQVMRQLPGIDSNVVEKWRMVVYSLLIILAMLFMPRGIFGRYEINDLFRFLRRRLGGAPGAVPEARPGATRDDRTAREQIPGEPRANAAPVLEALGVGMSFGGLRAVDDFNLTLGPRELVGLIGPNGAGKTTVFNVLTGVYRPTEGHIRFHGTPIAGLKPHRISRHGIARTFQNIRLFPNLSVLDNVQIAQHVHHRQGMAASILRTPGFFQEEGLSRKVALELLSIFKLDQLADEQATNLSYGDQRRLEIARALASRPRLLLLDEPAAGMNPTEKRQLMDMIRWIRDEFNLTILLIEHDMKVVMGICQRIIVLDYGKTIATGSPEQIRKDPAVIEAYLGAAARHD